MPAGRAYPSRKPWRLRRPVGRLPARYWQGYRPGHDQAISQAVCRTQRKSRRWSPLSVRRPSPTYPRPAKRASSVMRYEKIALRTARGRMSLRVATAKRIFSALPAGCLPLHLLRHPRLFRTALAAFFPVRDSSMGAPLSISLMKVLYHSFQAKSRGFLRYLRDILRDILL